MIIHKSKSILHHSFLYHFVSELVIPIRNFLPYSGTRLASIRMLNCIWIELNMRTYSLTLM